MWHLIPTENWDYNLRNLMRGLVDVLTLPRSRGCEPIGLPGVGKCAPVRSGRVGLLLALKALALPAGANVAVPLYCCPVVFHAIKAAGLRALFVDVDPATFCMSPTDLAAKGERVAAVIAVHMFGNPCDMHALQLAAPGKPIIEDCAQAFGSYIGDRPVGSFGDIAIFSFRSGKYVSIGEGGAIYCKNAEMNERILAQILQLASPILSGELTHVVKTYLRSTLRSKPLWGVVGERIWSAYSKTVKLEAQAPIVQTRIYETDRKGAARRIPTLSAQIEKQRANATYYIKHSALDKDVLCEERPGTSYNRMQFPLLMPSSSECEEFVAALRRRGISAARPYKDISQTAVKYFGYRGNCPLSEQIANTVLVVPCNFRLNGSDIVKVSRSLNHAWESLSRTRKMRLSSTITAGSSGTPENGNLKRVVETHQLS